MARNKNQHWVPGSYLQAWVDPNTPDNYEGYVHVFNRAGRSHSTKAPKNIFAMPDLYTIFEEGDRNLRIEDTFAKWERDFVRVRKTLENIDFGTGDDAADLYAFVGAMMERPPHRIEFFRRQLADIATKARSIRIDPSVPPIRPLTSGPGMTLDEFQRLSDDPMGTWFSHGIAANIEALSERFGCDVLVNESEHSFLTSDSPAVINFRTPSPDRRIPRGLGWPGCEITMPISPKMALLFRHKEPGIHAFLKADWECVFELNFLTITRAHQRIISDREDIFFVKTILDRVAEVDATATR